MHKWRFSLSNQLGPELGIPTTLAASIVLASNFALTPLRHL
jgi:hypothetical protein